jgi:acetyl-CoA carboxylase biotin carboxyl carrier protein
MSDQDNAAQPAPHEDKPQQKPREPERAGGLQRERDRGGRRRHQQQQNQPRRPEQQLPMDELRDLFALFTEHSLTEFEIEREGFRVHLGRNPAPSRGSAAQADAQAQMMTTTPALTSTPHVNTGGQGSGAAAATSGSPSGAAQAEPSATEDESLHLITSPIVGTFYRSPSPAAEPFVRLGSHVDPDSTVCIIEAMKLMNEIQSETTGEIAKIYVENGQPVEYGQPLFGVKK